MRARVRFSQSAGRQVALLFAAGVSFAAMPSCQPDVILGRNFPVPEEAGFIEGGASGLSSEVVGEEPWIGTAGAGGLGGEGEEPVLIQGHVCEVTHPGEVHAEPIAVCCDLEEAEQEWAQQVLLELNQLREAEGLSLLVQDPALSSASLAWAMHWSLHWDPVSEAGLPGRGYTSPRVADRCGSEANVIMYTRALDEPRDAEGLIPSSFPVAYWKADENLSLRILDPDYQRFGVGTYAGFLVALMDK